MSDIIERARLAHVKVLRDARLFDTIVGECPVQVFREALRAALAELREPTVEMMKAAEACHVFAAGEPDWGEHAAARVAWQAMIDEALK